MAETGKLVKRLAIGAWVFSLAHLALYYVHEVNRLEPGMWWRAAKYMLRPTHWWAFVWTWAGGITFLLSFGLAIWQTTIMVRAELKEIAEEDAKAEAVAHTKIRRRKRPAPKPSDPPQPPAEANVEAADA